MYIDEFKSLLKELQYLRDLPKLIGVATEIVFADKVLLLILWIVKYYDYAILSELFEVSKTVVSTLIDVLLPLLAQHFL